MADQEPETALDDLANPLPNLLRSLYRIPTVIALDTVTTMAIWNLHITGLGVPPIGPKVAIAMGLLLTVLTYRPTLSEDIPCAKERFRQIISLDIVALFIALLMAFI